MTLLLLVACRYDNPPATREIAWIDQETEDLARVACYDCHSNETDWKWYHHAPIVGSLVTGEVHRARCELNFSHWDFAQDDAWEAPEKVREGEMPLGGYTTFHPDAKLTDDEREILAAGLEATFEADPPLEHGRELCED
jgi:hypothetical protein